MVSMVMNAIANVMDWLPAAVSLVGGMLGIILSLVVIRAQWANGNKIRHELAALKRAERDRVRPGGKRKDDPPVNP